MYSSQRLRVRVSACVITLVAGVSSPLPAQAPSSASTTTAATAAVQAKRLASKPDIDPTLADIDDCSSALDIDINVDSDQPVDITRLSVILPPAYVIGGRDRDVEVPLDDQRDLTP